MQSQSQFDHSVQVGCANANGLQAVTDEQIAQRVLDAAEGALSTLEKYLFLSEIDGPETHVALRATDFVADETAEALGTYIAAVVAGAIGQDALLSDQLLMVSPDSAEEARLLLSKRLGDDRVRDEAAEKHFREHELFPWITENLGHALFVLRARGETASLPGPLLAVKPAHSSPTEQGLDLFGIFYDDDMPRIAVGEVKASEAYGKAALTDAAEFFESVDKLTRGVVLRGEVGALKNSLPPEISAKLGDGIWRDGRCYVPVIAHGSTINDLQDHAGLGKLVPPATRRRLVSLLLDDFQGFFDKSAQAARDALGAFYREEGE